MIEVLGFRVILGLYWDNGKRKWNYYTIYMGPWASTVVSADERSLHAPSQLDSLLGLKG